jgi:hypothetical protein
MSERSKAFPSAWVAQLFLRFNAIYGSRTHAMWGDQNPAQLQRVWAEELAAFEGEDLRTALSQLRHSFVDFPPTLFQFADLCADAKRRRLERIVKLDEQAPRRPIPEDIKESLDRLIGKFRTRF